MSEAYDMLEDEALCIDEEIGELLVRSVKSERLLLDLRVTTFNVG